MSQQSLVTPHSQLKGVREEDMEKYQEVLELLLAAGYYRIRISSLSPFDKVVGGLCWCIMNANVMVDVDVTFREDANIGQKIKVSEKIVRALRKMRCPHKIQSFQIQGLDFAVIFQVVQWLVKRVFEVREENQERIQRYSELVFAREFQMPQDIDRRRRYHTTRHFVEHVEGCYRPKRMFKAADQQAAGTKRSRWEHVQSVLLEYGRDFQAVKRSSTAATAAAAASEISEQQRLMEQKMRKQQEKDDEEQLRQIQALKDQLTEEAAPENVSSSSLNRIVGLSSSNIKKMSEEYMDKLRELEESGELGQSEEVLHRRRINAMKRQIQNQKQQYTVSKQQHDELAEKLKELQQEHTKYREYNDKVRERTRDMDREIELLMSGGDSDVDDATRQRELAALHRLQKLIMLNDSFKQQQEDFKLQCRKQLQELKDMIAKVENSPENDNEEKQNYEQLEKTLAADADRLFKIKSVLAQKNRLLAVQQRKIDEIPQRAEMTQYERRFTELYDQIVARLDETRKYYDVYNTLSDTHTYLEKRLSLLESMYEFFQKAKTSKGKEYRQWMVSKVGQSVDAVQKTKELVEKKMQSEISRREELNVKYTELVTTQRNYFRGIKQFQEEIHKNEELKRRLREFQQQQQQQEND